MDIVLRAGVAEKNGVELGQEARIIGRTVAHLVEVHVGEGEANGKCREPFLEGAEVITQQPTINILIEIGDFNAVHARLLGSVFLCSVSRALTATTLRCSAGPPGFRRVLVQSNVDDLPALHRELRASRRRSFSDLPFNFPLAQENVNERAYRATLRMPGETGHNFRPDLPNFLTCAKNPSKER